MNRRLQITLGLIVCLAAMVLVAAPVFAEGPARGQEALYLPIPVDIDARLRDMPVPAQDAFSETASLAVTAQTTSSLCGGDSESMSLTIPSFDPDNPGTQVVEFWRESPASSTGKATLWVAWDFLTTDYGEEHTITCEQLEYLQGKMDGIVETDTDYFGDYVQRPMGNENIDVMIYNIVDESYFDPTFQFYIAGFFWAAINDAEMRNMIFIDTLDWENRLGPYAIHPYMYEATVAHELQHLIHRDHDEDEQLWVEEGLSDLAEYLNGFGHPDGHVTYYLAYHRTSLTNWGDGLEDYGASYLFQLYLLENFGLSENGDPDPDWTRGLLDQQLDGIAAIEEQTGLSLNELFDAWIMANYIDDKALTGAANLPLGYSLIQLRPFSSVYGDWSIARAIEDIYGADHRGNLPVSRYYGGYQSGTVEYPMGALPPYTPLYGTYKGMEPAMNVLLRGNAYAGVAPHDGTYEVASGGGNLVSDRMLQLNTPVGGTLTFWTWFDIEEEWDYGFVEASTDEGATWAPLPGTITRSSVNPNGSTAWSNSLVSGLAQTDTAITGSSIGWVPANFTLPAASDVLVRFSYYTDEAYNGAGWFIDEVSVNGFSDGFEAGSSNWDLGGWDLTTGLFPNDWMAAYVLPVYERGKFARLDYGYMEDGFYQEPYEIIAGSFADLSLNRESATILFSNRPAESPFDAEYLVLVEKAPASSKK